MMKKIIKMINIIFFMMGFVRKNSAFLLLLVRFASVAKRRPLTLF